MLYGERSTTRAAFRDAGWGPIIAKSQSIIKCTLVKGESKFIYGEGSQPGFVTSYFSQIYMGYILHNYNYCFPLALAIHGFLMYLACENLNINSHMGGWGGQGRGKKGVSVHW